MPLVGGAFGGVGEDLHLMTDPKMREYEDAGVLTGVDRRGYRHGKNPIVSVETSQTQARRKDHEKRNIQVPQDSFFDMVLCGDIFYYVFASDIYAGTSAGKYSL